MAPFPWLEWADRALALFNTVALVWLGLTILLNAARRHLATWLTAGALLLGGLAAAAHAARLGAEGPLPVALAVDWWRLTWLPFAGVPYLWCIVLAWYTTRLRTPIEWAALVGLTVSGQGVLALLLARVPLVMFGADAAYAARDPATAAGGVSAHASTAAGDAAGLAQADPTLALVALLLHAGLCVGLGLLTLRYPRTSDRFMGELAFRRARPWLVATSAVVLALSVVVAVALAGLADVSPAWLDLLGLGLLALQATLMGRAVVSYEVFTGKALPRGGLARHWKNSLILAAGFGLSVSLSLELPIGGIYRLLLATVLVAAFYALVSWRSFVERERSLDRLRPFVTSEHAYDRLLGPDIARDGPPGDAFAEVDRRLAEPFRALCGDLLGARAGYLYPLGTLAPLVGAPLAHPGPAATTVPSTEAVAGLAASIGPPGRLCFPIDASSHGGATWCIPLWGERGLIGLLLLGDKRDGGLYTQEEIELARATGERLIDARATAELARRLLLLQRRRLAEDQILDGRARRALHDDILPLLHAAILLLSRRPTHRPAPQPVPVGVPTASNGAGSADTDAGQAEAVALLTDAHRQIGGLLRELPSALGPDLARLGLIGALRRTVDDLSDQFDGVNWRIDPDAERAVAALSPITAEVLFGAAREAIRNAARHARHGDRSRPLHLTVAAARHDGLELRIEDDGVGLRAARRAGPPDARRTAIPPSSPSGATPGGQGLLLHGTLLATLGGALLTESAPGASTRVILRVPTDS